MQDILQKNPTEVVRYPWELPLQASPGEYREEVPESFTSDLGTPFLIGASNPIGRDIQAGNSGEEAGAFTEVHEPQTAEVWESSENPPVEAPGTKLLESAAAFDPYAGIRPALSPERAALAADEITAVLGPQPAIVALYGLLTQPELPQAAVAAVLLGKTGRRSLRVNGIEVPVVAYLLQLSRLCREAADYHEAEFGAGEGAAPSDSELAPMWAQSRDLNMEECEHPDEGEIEPTQDAGEFQGAFDVQEETKEIGQPNWIDEAAAQPAFPPPARDSIEPLLEAKRVRDASQWNSARHPGKSGIDTNELRTRLERYLNGAAIEKAMRSSSALKDLLVDPSAVLAVLAHQFQQKVYASAAFHDGKIGEGTLDALGFVYHRDDSLNSIDALNDRFHVKGNSNAFKRLAEVYENDKASFETIGPDASPTTWYRLFVSAPFLGRPVNRGIHIELMRRLRQAERWLLSQSPYRNLSPVQIGVALRIDEDHLGGRTKNNSSMHTLGLAVDIGSIKNPWVAGQAESPMRNANFQAVTKNVSRLLSGTEQETVTPRWLASLGADAANGTEAAYRKIESRHKNLQKYLSLGRDAEKLKSVIFQHRHSKHVIREKESIEAAVRRWQGTIKSDRIRLQHALSSKRKPEAGFLNLHRDLVVALRDHGCLAWGAIDLGTNQSGDVMHFDCRATGIGWKLALPKQRTALGHPCWSKSRTAEAFEIPRSSPMPAAGAECLGGQLSEFTAKSIPLRVAVFCPRAANSSNDVEVLIYVHGLLFPCPPVPERPTDLITKKPFGLGKIVDASSRKIILVVPFIAWKRQQPHPLGDPAILNRFVGEVLNEVGKMRGSSAPSLRGLILAGHSRAYGFLDPLAKAHVDPEMSRGPLSMLTEVWAFDTAYTSPVADYRAWLSSDPNLVFHVFYREGSDEKPPLTRKHGRRFRDLAKRSGGRFNVKAVPECHCLVPLKRLPGLLAASVLEPQHSVSSSSVRELQFEEEYEEEIEEEYEEEIGETEQGESQHVEHFAQDELALEEEPRAAEKVWFERDEEEEFFLEETADAQEEARVIDDEAYESPEAHELDPSALDIAEKMMARELSFEHQVSTRWRRCFSTTDIAKIERIYRDNNSAASTNSIDRCSCIVMLNVALGELLSLPLKPNRARGQSNRIVQMANLTTESIDKAMTQLRRNGYAVEPTVMNFYDRRNKTAGTLKPERLKTSVQAKVVSLANTKGCWFAFGLSIMDGYHSVLLLVDRSAATPKIYWCDQFSNGVTDDVTSRLDQLITDKTQGWWQAVMDEKGKGYNTTIRLWPLRAQ
jgi:hypothetical protein